LAAQSHATWRQRYEFSKQLQDLHIDVALLSGTHLKLHRRFFIPRYHLYWSGHFPERKCGTAVEVKKGVPHNHVDLAPLVSLETAEVSLPIGNGEVLLAAIRESPVHAWNDADIIERLRFRHMSLLTGGLNAKNPFWSSVVSNFSGAKLLNLMHINEFEISAPQCPTQSPTENGDVLSEVIVADFLDSYHLPIIFHLLDHIRTRNLSGPVDKFTDWERFQSLASDLISPKIKNNLVEEADKAARDNTPPVASAYRLSTSKINSRALIRICLVWRVCYDMSGS
jgi:hypothetical protein